MKKETTNMSFINSINYEKEWFNSQQNFLYKRALFGLSVYTKEELTMMHVDKQKRITKVYLRTQSVLNLWKQELTIKITNKYLEKTFPKSSFIKSLISNFTETFDPKFVNILDFKTLGITKKQIINKLIIQGILPRNFYDLIPIEKPFVFKFKKKLQEKVLC